MPAGHMLGVAAFVAVLLQLGYVRHFLPPADRVWRLDTDRRRWRGGLLRTPVREWSASPMTIVRTKLMGIVWLLLRWLWWMLVMRLLIGLWPSLGLTALYLH